jgi:hypothetical protein
LDSSALFAGIASPKESTDVPILVAAMKARVGYLVTLNRKHFLEDAALAQ